MKRQQWWIVLSLCLVVGLALVLTAGTAMAQKCDPKDPKCVEPPTGTPCSPGFWKNHPDEFGAFCDEAAATSADFADCDALLTALTCQGSDASCKRSLAAAALNTVSGCEE